MKKIASFLMIGLVLLTSTLFADVNETIMGMVNTFAWAVVPFEEGLQFPSRERVRFTQLLDQSGPVSLCEGGLKLPKGIYKVYYAVQLQNTGKADVMQLWLTTKVGHSKKSKAVLESSFQVSILAADNSTLQRVSASRELTIKLKESSVISLNYATHGESRLSTVSFSTLKPIPFSLIARKIAEK